VPQRGLSKKNCVEGDLLSTKKREIRSQFWGVPGTADEITAFLGGKLMDNQRVSCKIGGGKNPKKPTGPSL